MNGRKNYIGIVLKKELTDVFRDRKTLWVSLILPLVLYPLIFFVMDKAMSPMINMEEQKFSVAIIADDQLTYTELAETILAADNITVVSPEDPLGAVSSGDVDVAVYATRMENQQLAIELVYDDNRSASMSGHTYVQMLIGQFSEQVMAARLQEMGVNLDELSAFSSVTTRPYSQINGGDEQPSGANMMLSMMLPMLITIYLAVGGMAISADIFAGEKERRTFEPLLCTRAGRFDILTGKLMTVTMVSILSVIASFAGMALGYMSAPTMFSMGLEGDAAGLGSLNFPVGIMLLTALMLIMMAVLFSGIYACISMYSRTTKEANTYSSFVMLASYVPVMATMFMQGGDVKTWMMAIPVINIVCSLKMILAGVVNYGAVALALVCSAVFMAAILAFTLHLFKKERIMFRT